MNFLPLSCWKSGPRAIKKKQRLRKQLQQHHHHHHHHLKMSCSSCRGLTRMSFYCLDDPCRLGQNYGYGMRCECELNGGAVAGIVIAVIFLVCVPLIGLTVYCIFKRHRENRERLFAQQGGAPGVVAYNPQVQMVAVYPQVPQPVSAVPVYVSPAPATYSPTAYPYVPAQTTVSTIGYGVPQSPSNGVPPYVTQSNITPSYLPQQTYQAPPQHVVFTNDANNQGPNVGGPIKHV